MRYRSHVLYRHYPSPDPDFDGALDAMTLDDLRLFVREALSRLDLDVRTELQDSLIDHAAKGSSGWRPTSPSSQVVEEVSHFVKDALRRGDEEPHKVDDCLRKGTRAFGAPLHRWSVPRRDLFPNSIGFFGAGSTISRKSLRPSSSGATIAIIGSARRYSGLTDLQASSVSRARREKPKHWKPGARRWPIAETGPERYVRAPIPGSWSPLMYSARAEASSADTRSS